MRRFAALAAVLLLAAGSAAAAGGPADLLPKTQEVLAWSVARDAATYDGGSLEGWQGEDAALVADYGFVAGADAVFAGPDDGRITIEVFQMGSAADAGGLLRCLGAGSKVETLDIGQDAWVGDGAGALWQGVYCARVIAEEGSAAASVIKDFLGIIAGRAGEDGFLPDIFRAIDTIGYVEGSARFLRTNQALARLHFVAEENVLELSPDTEMVIGTFLIDGRGFEAFIIRYPTEREAIAGATSYAAFLGNDPEVEAAWFKQWGRVVAGTWTGLAVPETTDSEYMLFNTIGELVREIRIFQLQR